MAQSIIIVGPQGCGKSMNAPGLCKAFGVTKWVDAADIRYLPNGDLPQEDHLIFAHDWPKNTHGLRCVNFEFAISKVDNPHPMTPKPLHFSAATGHADYLKPEAKDRRFWPVSGA